MAEIKSTLDIIMEKTKGLSMSDEEKHKFKKGEVEGKVRGFLQKYIDGFMNIEKIQIEMAAFGEESRDIAKQALIGDCADRIGLEEDNQPIFEMLEEIGEVDSTPFKSTISEYMRNLEKEKEVYENNLIQRLRETGISGSAVIPNIEGDQEWRNFLSQVKANLNSEIKALVAEEKK